MVAPVTPRARAPSASPIVALALASVALACNGKATAKDCTEMMDKYLEMTTAGDPSLEGLSEAETTAAREMKIAIRRGEPAYARVHDQCEAEISKKEYRCAMRADNPDQWQACID